MKQKTEANGTSNDDWETPKFILDWVQATYGSYFDPCPLKSSFDGLSIEWEDVNYINPPYNRFDKPKFIKKAIEEYKKGKTCILLIPANTETSDFKDLYICASRIMFIHKRVCFKGTNTKGEYVTNKTGQTGSMIVVLGPRHKRDKIIELVSQDYIRDETKKYWEYNK